MFELSPPVLEALLFAMEDQDSRSVIDLASGEVRPAADPQAGGSSAPLPGWSSREGFQLMEDFVARVRRPGARRELQEALARGKGVFKAFKEVLAAWPDQEKAFRDHKARAMGRAVAVWYEELREQAGLERLPPEPDEEDDLVRSDFDIVCGGRGEGLERLLGLLDDAEEEALAEMPGVLASYEAERLREVLNDEDWIGAWIDDGEDGAIAGGAAFVEEHRGQAFVRVFFLQVLPAFRRSGLGMAILERLGAAPAGEAAPLLVIDAPLLPPDLAEPLAARGFSSWGLHLKRRL